MKKRLGVAAQQLLNFTRKSFFRYNQHIWLVLSSSHRSKNSMMFMWNGDDHVLIMTRTTASSSSSSPFRKPILRTSKTAQQHTAAEVSGDPSGTCFSSSSSSEPGRVPLGISELRRFSRSEGGSCQKSQGQRN